MAAVECGLRTLHPLDVPPLCAVDGESRISHCGCLNEALSKDVGWREWSEAEQNIN